MASCSHFLRSLFSFICVWSAHGLASLSSSSVSSPMPSSCPSFASPKASCSLDTCGFFVYRGSFVTPSVAHLRVPSAKDGIRLGRKAAPADCCKQCRIHNGCAYWNFFTETGLCLLYSDRLCSSDASADAGLAVADGSRPLVYLAKEKNSYVGGRCNGPLASMSSSLVSTTQGKSANYLEGAAEDHEVLPDKSFCLFSDSRLHINMLLSGYWDERVGGATFTRNGRTIRTWIREVAVMWTNGVEQHVLKMSSRKGPDQDRGEGYLGQLEVDGTTIPRLQLGDELNLFDGQATVVLDAYEKAGPYDVDVYTLKVESLLEAEIRLRMAHPLLQLPHDAQVHLNMDILDVAASASTHGILGQSYRDESLERALNYTILATLMDNPELPPATRNAALGLEGFPDEYLTSDLLTPDCKYSQFSLLPAGGGSSSSSAGRKQEEQLQSVKEGGLSGGGRKMGGGERRAVSSMA
eukprot:TRINITY_DN3080_c0_g5_i1.p1 TRINITY_DN3080_c0_g5~~TRINITY_DN3080_c0_g5_i1.p1  ORF type:complete len:466 (-),score=115.26 TRINITY_DN3080_c0_g5_i1:215-1612(-)